MNELDDLKNQTIRKFNEAVNLRVSGKYAEADTAYSIAQRLYERLEEETAILNKPQPPSGGSYNGIEI